jgi:hypothetical protein
MIRTNKETEALIGPSFPFAPYTPFHQAVTTVTVIIEKYTKIEMHHHL